MSVVAGRAPALGRLRRRGARSGLIVWLAVVTLGLLAFVALAAPLLAPHDPTTLDLSHALAGPSGAHPLGTDASGRDLLSRLMYGARSSLIGPLAVVLLATAASTALGVAAAWAGGWVDGVIARGLDVVFSFPGILLAILAVALFGRGLGAPIAALAIAYTPYIARVARAAALRERRQPYVAACELQGLSPLRICGRHLLPNIAPVLLAQASLAFGLAMVDMAAISFLGFGVQPPTADWGAMVGSGQSSLLKGFPQETLFAGALIAIAVVAVTVLGQRVGRSPASEERA
ncbi:MAG: ABC transporter permease [Conexibacter sp.]